MLLRNFPLKNGRPRGAEQTQNYVDALALKRSVDEMAEEFVERNQGTPDLDISSDGVALNNYSVYTESLSSCRTKGVLSMGPGENGESAPVYMRTEVVPKKLADRTLTLERRGDRQHYTRQLKDSSQVEHLVHDHATDTINYFVRDEQGRFPKKS